MRIETNNNEFYSSNSQVDSKEIISPVKKIINKTIDPLTNENKNNKNLDSLDQVKEHEVIEAIEKANKHFKTFDRHLEFSIHEKTKQIMVKVINTEDNSVVREIPSEKILDMVAKLWEMSGIFVDEKR